MEEKLPNRRTQERNIRAGSFSHQGTMYFLQYYFYHIFKIHIFPPRHNVFLSIIVFIYFFKDYRFYFFPPGHDRISSQSLSLSPLSQLFSLSLLLSHCHYFCHYFCHYYCHYYWHYFCHYFCNCFFTIFGIIFVPIIICLSLL